MKLKKGDNVVEVPDLSFLIDVRYIPAGNDTDWNSLLEIRRPRFEMLDKKMKGPPRYCCAFPHCITVWPPLDQDGELIVRYYPTAKEI